MSHLIKSVARLVVGLLMVVFAVVAALAARPIDDPAPVSLTEVEKLKAENVSLKSQLTEMLNTNSKLQSNYGQCQAQLGPLQHDQNAAAVSKEYQEFVADIEKQHPGFTWDPQSGALMVKPAPAQPAGK